MYHRKYWKVSDGYGRRGDGGNLTWLVHTLLKVTKAKVCASMVDGRSRFANTSGIATALKHSWGTNASDSRCRLEDAAGEELRYSRVL